MRVVLFKGASAYGATRTFIDEAAAAFERKGYTPSIVDVIPGMDLPEALRREAEAGPIALAYSITILGEFRDATGRSIGEMLGAPHVLHHVDYPLTHIERLAATSPDTAVLVIDETHVEAIVSTLGESQFAYVGFCPHAACGEPAPDDPDAQSYAAGRDIPILFSGTFYKADTPVWADAPAQTRTIFDAALEIALSQEFVPALTAFDRALTAHGIDPQRPEMALARRSANLVHEHVRAHRRFELLKAAAKARLPLHIYGKGFESQLYRFKTVTYGGEASLTEITQLMRRSRVVLNVNANFGAGSHERPLSAMLAGAAAASDFSTFYAGAFEAGRDIALYRWMALPEGLAAVEALAGDAQAGFAMAAAGKAKAVAGHRWDNRVDQILLAAAAARRT